jgi:conjugal transfer pilus assembly protein TraV
MRKIILAIMLTIFSLSGCIGYLGDKLLNPYASEFQCPVTDKGECIKLKDAYEKSLRQSNPGAEINIYKEGETKTQTQGSETQYQKAMFERLKGLLNEPETPLLMTPKVVRVLFLPYKSDGNILMMPRYAYFFLDEPQWVLGNYLNPKGDE